MNTQDHIPISDLCIHYKLDLSYFKELEFYGLIETVTFETKPCIHQEQISKLEKMIRMQRDLNLNFEGIDTVFNLLNKVERLQSELYEARSRLKLYEE